MSLYFFLRWERIKIIQYISVDSSWKSIILVFYISFPNASDVSSRGGLIGQLLGTTKYSLSLILIRQYKRLDTGPFRFISPVCLKFGEPEQGWRCSEPRTEIGVFKVVAHFCPLGIPASSKQKGEQRFVYYKAAETVCG
jgi:hypothetical protein